MEAKAVQSAGASNRAGEEHGLFPGRVFQVFSQLPCLPCPTQSCYSQVQLLPSEGAPLKGINLTAKPPLKGTLSKQGEHSRSLCPVSSARSVEGRAAGVTPAQVWSDQAATSQGPGSRAGPAGFQHSNIRMKSCPGSAPTALGGY